jgi:hypothetical protein
MFLLLGVGGSQLCSVFSAVEKCALFAVCYCSWVLTQFLRWGSSGCVSSNECSLDVLCFDWVLQRRQKAQEQELDWCDV